METTENKSINVAASHRLDSFYVDYWGWRTRAQIIALHGGDAKAADEIIAEKVAGGMVQDHPDSAQLKTYFVPSLIYSHNWRICGS